ncbi:MAG: threonine--tRNA ligase, partial [Candidatus Paceibacterota bacterium]
FGQNIRKKYGYIKIKTPQLAKNDLWITSGHWDHYKDDMFVFDIENDTYCLKPMDCPFNIQIYQTKQRSYRDLPIRYTEIGRVMRNEKSGELNGLFRVREITQDDSHVFLREDQIEEEISNLIKIVQEYYDALGVEPKFFLSTRPEDFMGEIKVWDRAESDLKSVLSKHNINYGLKEGDGAFYGPKIDINIADALGRSWQVATIQLDFQLPQRFNCEYVSENGERKTPVMIHAAVFGSFERMTGILIEHYAGAFPFWLSPVQIEIIPVGESHRKYAKEIAEKLKEYRVKIDEDNETIGKKIRAGEMEKIPYLIVVGDKEIENKTISVRQRGKIDLGEMTIEDFSKIEK